MLLRFNFGYWSRRTIDACLRRGHGVWSSTTVNRQRGVMRLIDAGLSPDDAADVLRAIGPPTR